MLVSGEKNVTMVTEKVSKALLTFSVGRVNHEIINVSAVDKSESFSC